jgi:hypothetical protein
MPLAHHCPLTLNGISYLCKSGKKIAGTWWGLGLEADMQTLLIILEGGRWPVNCILEKE